MKNWKRILSSVLVFCLLAGFAPSAFAAEDSTELVYADSGESVTVGNVTVTGEGDAASANAYDGGSASLTVEGSVTQTAENASVSPVDVYSSGEGSVAAVNISGDVSGEGVGGTGVSASGSDGGSAQVQVDGKVDVEGDQSADGIQAFANNNASVVISVGEGIDASVSSDNSEYSSATGVSSVSSTGSTIDIDVNGDVSAESGMYSTGVSSSAHSDGKADINITGNINTTGDQTATAISANGNGDTTVTVEGDVSAEASGTPSTDGEDGPNWSEATGVRVQQITTNGDIVINITGDVSAENSGDYAYGTIQQARPYPEYKYDEETDLWIETDDAEPSTAKSSVNVTGNISASSATEAYGAMLYARSGASTELHVEGNVSADADKVATGIEVSNETNGTAVVSVVGDVSSNHDGLTVYGDGTGSIAVTIDGTLSGDDAAVRLGSSDVTDSLTLTVWKAELNEDGKVVVPSTLSEEQLANIPDEQRASVEKGLQDLSDAAEAVEANILYIIKLEQPNAGGSLSLSGTTKSDGYDVAKEGDNVVLLIAVAEGYQLDAAYNGDGTKVALQQDSNGNYFLVVPKGGGVYFSADFSQIPVVEAAPVYTPVVAPAKKAIAKAEDEISAEIADAEGKPIAVVVKDSAGNVVKANIDIVFYDDSTFEIDLDFDGNVTRLQGSFKLVDGVLTFTLKNGSEIQLTEDGILVIPLANGNTLEIKLDQATIDALTKSLK